MIVLAEEPVRGPPHMHHVLGMPADAAENAEHALHEERRLHETPVDEVGKRVEMPDVVALNLEPRAVIGASRENRLDIGEGVLEDMIARPFEVGLLPSRAGIAVKRPSIGKGRSSSSPC